MLLVTTVDLPSTLVLVSVPGMDNGGGSSDDDKSYEMDENVSESHSRMKLNQ